MNIKFFRINDIEKATAAKFKIEQKQREEAKTRKEENGSYPNRVSFYLNKKPVIFLKNSHFSLFSTSQPMARTGCIAILSQEDLILRLNTKFVLNTIKKKVEV